MSLQLKHALVLAPCDDDDESGHNDISISIYSGQGGVSNEILSSFKKTFSCIQRVGNSYKAAETLNTPVSRP